jgi:hypothetical protein
VVSSSSDLAGTAAFAEVLHVPHFFAEWTTSNLAWLIWENPCRTIPAAFTGQNFAHSSKIKHTKIADL